MNEKQIKNFWAKVDKSDYCWNWRGTKVNGYGLMRISLTRKNILAHRLSYLIHFGEIPSALFVLHKCDNRGCVNPDHLFLGTLKDNTQDMLAKGRQRYNPLRGELHPRAKMSDEQIKDFRNRLGYRNIAALGREFGISKTQAHRIANGEHWSLSA